MSNTTYYESQQKILERMLSKTGLLADEGSTSYIIQSPISIELERIKAQQDEIINRNNIISAYENGYEDEVVKYAEQDGIDRKSSNEATGIETFYGTVGTVIKAGTKFGDKANGLVYETVLDGTIGQDGSVDILSVSIKKGVKYNAKANTLNYMPIKLIGVTSCTNKYDFTKGRDIESIDDLFYRHQLKMRSPSTSGNKYDYENWALEIDGVGYAKCIPSAGNVRVVIATNNKRKANQELIQATYNHIDDVRPLLAGTLTVDSVKEVEITIAGNVEIDTSTTLNTVQNTLSDLLEKYFDNTVYKTKKVSIAKIQSIIMEIDGVTDCGSVKVNNGTSNISLEIDEVATLKNIQLGVM